MLGYTTKQQAIELGMTHYGTYYSIPIYLKGVFSGDITVMAKWRPIDCLISVVAQIEMFMRPLVFPDEEPVFQFVVFGPLAT